MLAVRDLRSAYDSQLRARVPARLPEGVRVEHDGPLLRRLGAPGGGFVEYRDLGDLDGAALEELISRQVEVFAGRGERFEWKLHGHDAPADLADRLLAAGFVPEDEETVMIARAAEIATTPRLPAGAALREVTAREDLDRIAALEEAVWRKEPGWREGDRDSLAESLELEQAADPEALKIVVVEARSRVVCAGWVRFEDGTDFGTLWGGSTLAAWRGRGLYRATVAHRANLAAERGFGHLEVDASRKSRPTLERLGFVAVTTTTPYVWSPG